MQEKTAHNVYDKYEMLEQNSQQRNTRGNQGGMSVELASQMASLSIDMKSLMGSFGKQLVVVDQESN